MITELKWSKEPPTGSGTYVSRIIDEGSYEYYIDTEYGNSEPEDGVEWLLLNLEEIL